MSSNLSDVLLFNVVLQFSVSQPLDSFPESAFYATNLTAAIAYVPIFANQAQRAVLKMQGADGRGW